MGVAYEIDQKGFASGDYLAGAGINSLSVFSKTYGVHIPKGCVSRAHKFGIID